MPAPPGRGNGVAWDRYRARPSSMAQRKGAPAPCDIMGAMVFDRENVDQVGQSEVMLDAADIDVNLAVADV